MEITVLTFDKWTVYSVPNITGTTIKKFLAVLLASWNVRTLTPGFSQDLLQINDNCKTAVIDAELSRLNMDIAALQDTGSADDGTLQEKMHTFFWKGKNQYGRREHGVGFLVKTTLLLPIDPPTALSETLLRLRLNTTYGPVNLVSGNAPPSSLTEQKTSSTMISIN
ncbi:hypothetical protein HOLleu_42611 [Holothuria leucospilota]|uniref:Uncharacterized protein n=1 Tax=Holothuria leucospilota TaxID=206669 RepID=A0A9Q0YEP7_HOLLE|nr:hypothetical protein HOLleu_42611 [Holothuria leucospilota]